MDSWARNRILKEHSKKPIIIAMVALNLVIIVILSLRVFDDLVDTIIWLLSHYILVILAEAGLYIGVGTIIRTRLDIKYERGYRDGCADISRKRFINLPRYYAENHVVYIAGFDQAYIDEVARLREARMREE